MFHAFSLTHRFSGVGLPVTKQSEPLKRFYPHAILTHGSPPWIESRKFSGETVENDFLGRPVHNHTPLKRCVNETSHTVWLRPQV